MTETPASLAIREQHESSPADRRLRRRYAAERRFRLYGLLAIGIAIAALSSILLTIVLRASGALSHPVVRLAIHYDPALLDPAGTGAPEVLAQADYGRVLLASLLEILPAAAGRQERRELMALVSAGAAFDLRDRLLEQPGRLGTRETWPLPLSDDAKRALAAGASVALSEPGRRLSDRQLGWLEELKRRGLVESAFNFRFFRSGDSREPELAGVWGAVVGSALTLAVTLLLCFPIGVAAAVYLQEFAPKNRWTDLIEVNINNLAAVPSIVFGLLGLAVFLNTLGLPRSAPLVGGMVLALMTLPTVIIAARSALMAVPPSIREAALGVGASPVQSVFGHVLPLALPGILTGTILGMARALGETAPLLMIGMVAFIVDVPDSFTAPATTLPVQIFLWADSPERGFVEKTSAAILVLLAFLVLMNLGAVILRRRFERRW